jgi:hypothetical protein
MLNINQVIMGGNLRRRGMRVAGLRRSTSFPKSRPQTQQRHLHLADWLCTQRI